MLPRWLPGFEQQALVVVVWGVSGNCSAKKELGVLYQIIQISCENFYDRLRMRKCRAASETHKHFGNEQIRNQKTIKDNDNIKSSMQAVATHRYGSKLSEMRCIIKPQGRLRHFGLFCLVKLIQVFLFL